MFPACIGCGDFTLNSVSSLSDPCPLPEKERERRRTLNEKERLIYAPMSGVGSIVYDKVWLMFVLLMCAGCVCEHACSFAVSQFWLIGNSGDCGLNVHGSGNCMYVGEEKMFSNHSKPSISPTEVTHVHVTPCNTI